MSKGEFNSVAQVNGGIENMIIILIIQKAGQRRKEKSLQLQEYKIRLYDSIF